MRKLIFLFSVLCIGFSVGMGFCKAKGAAEEYTFGRLVQPPVVTQERPEVIHQVVTLGQRFEKDGNYKRALELYFANARYEKYPEVRKQLICAFANMGKFVSAKQALLDIWPSGTTRKKRANAFFTLASAYYDKSFLVNDPNRALNYDINAYIFAKQAVQLGNSKAENLVRYALKVFENKALEGFKNYISRSNVKIVSALVTNRNAFNKYALANLSRRVSGTYVTALWKFEKGDRLLAAVVVDFGTNGYIVGYRIVAGNGKLVAKVQFGPWEHDRFILSAKNDTLRLSLLRPNRSPITKSWSVFGHVSRKSAAYDLV